jgi:predicted MPP superfamily phosphohydrolase
LRETVERTNAAQADLVLLLGDLVTMGVLGGSFVEPEPIAAVLGKLRAPAGVWAVLGNHDRSYDGPRVQRALEAVGIRALEDTAVALMTTSGPLWLAGVSDFWTGRHDVARAIATVADTVNPVILITHNPDIFPRVPARVLLTLAGHTHGGQVRLPILGAPIVPSRFGPRYTKGQIVEGGRHLYVSSGIGTSFLPVRFRVPPTIFVLTVRRADGRRGRAAGCAGRLRQGRHIHAPTGQHRAGRSSVGSGPGRPPMSLPCRILTTVTSKSSPPSPGGLSSACSGFSSQRNPGACEGRMRR